MVDRFGQIPTQVEALLLETEIRCLAQEAGFDCISNKGNDLMCRKVRLRSSEGVKYLRKLGKFPKIDEKEPLLKLKEIIRFLKIELYGT